MTINRCVGRLVAAGRITAKEGDDVLAMFRGVQGQLYETMPPASANAAAIQEVVNALRQSAQEKRFHAQHQAIRSSDIQDRLIEGSGQRGAVGARIVDEIDARIENVQARLFRLFNTALEEYRSKFPGLRPDLAGPRNMVRELFGVDTGDQVAKAAAAGWERAAAYSVTRAKAAGKLFEDNEDWRLPQFWESSRVRDRQAEFMADMRQAVHSGALVVFDKETMTPIRIGDAQQLEALETVLHRAYTDIVAEGERPGVFSALVRTFQFQEGRAGAEAWLNLMAKYGGGQDVMAMLTGQLGKMSRDIGSIETLGPKPNATMRMMVELMQEEEREMGGAGVGRSLRLESSQAVERAWRVISGKADQVKSDAIAGFFGGLRSLATATNLGGAVVSAVPGDTVTMALAAHANGLAVTRVLAGTAREIAGGVDARAQAARLNVVAHAVMDAGIAGRRFDDQVAGPELLRNMAQFVIRAQGLQRWTESAKRAFTMEFLGTIADQGRVGWSGLDANFRGFLEKHRFTREEWNTLRSAAPLEVEGARFFDLDAAEAVDARLARRLMDAVLQERRMAVIEPNSRVRGLTTGALERGTWTGELTRSTMMFKSFPITVAMMHILPAFTHGASAGVRARAAAYVLLSTTAGAAAIWAKDILAGREPRPPDNFSFWGAAFAQGGGGGIYGDFLYSATARTGTQPLAVLGGPLATQGEQLLRLVHQGYRQAFDPDQASLGVQFARTMKTFAPGSSLWYARLALDRAVFDQISLLVDPDGGRRTFRRMESRIKREMGSSYWWRPGQLTPG